MADVPSEARIFKGATRERVRKALASLVEEALRADKSIVSVAKLRGAGSGDQNATTTLLRLWRSGELSVATPWDDPPPPPAAAPAGPPAGEGLAARITAAQTHNDLLGAGKAVAVALLEQRDGVDTDVAARLTQLLTEMRQSVKGRSLEPKEVLEAVLPVTEEAAPLVEAFEGIESDERRARILVQVQAELEADRRERPTLDTGGEAT